MKRITILFLLVSFFTNAQILTDSQKQHIDSLTAHWNSAKNPGGAIAIIHKGALILQKTSGLSDVAASVPITPQTSFQLAQLSDSFIAYALLQLAQENKLSLDDTIHKHLPDLGNVLKDLQVKHLLQQASGIQDFETLKHLAGWSEGGRFSVQEALRLIKSQKKPSFRAGTEFSYSRSNILIASLILEKVSQVDLPTYMKEHVFKPLRMNNTAVITPKNQNGNGIALSYAQSEEGVITAIPPKKETYAGINIASSIEDMVLWELNLETPSPPNKALVTEFKKYVTLNNGSQYSVPAGKLTYGQRYVHKERGLETVMVTGGIDGFASAIFNFPSEEFTVITLSNNGEAYNGYIGMLSAHALLEKAFLEPPTINFEAMETIALDRNYHSGFEGFYWDALGELSREIRIEDDTLRYIRSSEVRSTLIPVSANTFQMKTDFDDKIFITFSKDAEKNTKMLFTFGEATPIEFVKYTPVIISQEALDSLYTGDYYCAALGIGYQIRTSNNTLMASNAKAEPHSFMPITSEIFLGNQWYMRSIEFVMDTNQKHPWILCKKRCYPQSLV